MFLNRPPPPQCKREIHEVDGLKDGRDSRSSVKRSRRFIYHLGQAQAATSHLQAALNPAEATSVSGGVSNMVSSSSAIFIEGTQSVAFSERHDLPAPSLPGSLTRGSSSMISLATAESLPCW